MLGAKNHLGLRLKDVAGPHEAFPCGLLNRNGKDSCFSLRPLRTQAATSPSAALPYAFTEHGALVVASVLNTPRALEISIFVMKAFVKLRETISTNKNLARRLDELEKKYDGQFQEVFEAIRQLMIPTETPKKRIGFHLKEKQASFSEKGV